MPLTHSAEAPVPLRIVVGEVKKWVERLGSVWVEGQVVQLTRRSGSLHFLTLRDTSADVSVSVSTSTRVLDSVPTLTEGATVAALLKPIVYSSSGRLMFDCTELRPIGIGTLLAQIEQRRRQLHAEGLFDPQLKSRLPFLPRKIGLVTGAGSAAERDVLVNVADRWPAAVFETRHTPVQGPAAAAAVMQAVTELDQTPDVDVIVIARGGGSFEDLLPFSDEGLLRAVFACRTPVVSAIGHEVDTPLLDLVADLRASTPTDAAKRIVPSLTEQNEIVTVAHQKLRRTIDGIVDQAQASVDAIRTRPVMTAPSAIIDLHDERLTTTRERMRQSIHHVVKAHQTDLAHFVSRARALSPQRTLARGYAIVTADDGAAITQAGALSAGDKITAVFAEGSAQATVTETTPPRRNDG